MARRTTRQKRVHSLLEAYQHIKCLQLYQRQRHATRWRSTDANRNTDTDSDTSSMTSGSTSLSSFGLGSSSSLSLSSRDSNPDQDDMSSDDSLGNSDHSPLPAKHRHGLQGLTFRVRKAISQIYSRRYHKDRKFGHGRPPPYLPLILTTYKDHEEFHPSFRQYLRIDHVTFDKILVAISSDPLFINRSRHPQMPIDYQLAITLYCFGYYGNAAGLQRVADWAGVGKGTVLIATCRIMTAVLQSSFKNQAIRMPTPGEKEEAKQWVERCSRCPTWRDGWCFVDGMLIPLAFRPFWYGQSYFDRKCNYSLNIQV